MFYKEPNQYINEGKQFTVDGVTYPANWLNQATPEQKAAIGLQEVVTTNQPFDPKYYWTGETLEGAKLTYSGIPKDLADVQNQAVEQVNQTAYTLLFPTDWMAVKAFETGEAMAEDWALWRASIRSTASDSIATIKNATDIDSLIAVMDNIIWANDPDYVAPIEKDNEVI